MFRLDFKPTFAPQKVVSCATNPGRAFGALKFIKEKMNISQIFSSAEHHTEKKLWQELSEQEASKIGGGKYLPGFQYFNGRRLLRIYTDKCVVLPAWQAFIPNADFPTLLG